MTFARGFASTLRRACAVVALAAALPAHAGAGAVVLQNGPHVGFTVNPFDAIAGTTRYQQVYSAAAFTGPVKILSIAFSPGATGSYAADITVRLTTTPVGVGHLSTALDSNYARPLTTVFAGTVSQDVAAGADSFDLVVDFPATPFLYNPAEGNLLLDVVVSNQHLTGGDPYFSVSYAGAGSVSSVAYDSAVFGNMLGQIGLRTLIQVQAPVAATPVLPTERGRHVLRVGPGRAYATIQDAVDAAAPGSRILVDPGTYREMVLVRTSNLQILAQGPGTLVVPALWNPFPPPGHLWGGVAFTVLADHVTVQGFEIEFALASAEQGRTCQFAIYFEGSHNVFADNYMFARPGGGCPGVTPLSSTPLAGGSNFNTIERNVVNGADVGILIGASEPDAVNVGNTIRDNLLFNVFQAPIAITNAAWFEVSGNLIAGTSAGPCMVIGADSSEVEQGHHTIRNNAMRRCGGNGITLYANPGTTVAHNRIVGNRIHRVAADGIQLWSYEGATLSDNEVAGNGVSRAFGNGIFLGEGANGNRILGNELGPWNSVGIGIAGDFNLAAGNCVHRSVVADVVDLGAGNRWVNNRCAPGRR